MRYFRDIVAVKRYCAALINDYEASKLSSQKFRDLLAGCNTMLKIFQQVYLEKQLQPIQSRLEQLEEGIGEI